MAVVKAAENRLQASSNISDGQYPSVKKIKPAKKVLDEEEFLENLETIIQRDFFPDLSKLKAQKEYIEAAERNDLVKMRELAVKYASTGQTAREMETPLQDREATPATFETPDMNPRRPSPFMPQGAVAGGGKGRRRHETPSQEDDGGVEDGQQDAAKTKKGNPKLSLDKYLAVHTSEDNASFDEIMATSEEKHRQKHAWLYEAEQRHAQEQVDMLALEGPESMKPIEGSSVTTWGYKARNTVMYVPQGLEETPEEQIFKKPKAQQVLHRNTHFHNKPFRAKSGSMSVMAKSAAVKASMKMGRIGHDGKEIASTDSPKINGFGFIAEPSPSPGAFNESPMMTWGEISGTPFRLDGSDTPVHSTAGPSFTIAKVPRKERLVLSLVEEVSKKHRAKKQKALQRVTESLVSPSPKRVGTIGSLDRLRTLTPAAQKLVNKKLSGFKTDKALRASYTPSPARTPADDRTPELRRTPRQTPTRTPGKTPSSGSAPVEETLTDNLLNLPKRKTRQRMSAMDFF